MSEFNLNQEEDDLFIKEQWDYYSSNNIDLYYHELNQSYQITTIKNKKSIKINDFNDFEKVQKMYKSTIYLRTYCYLIDQLSSSYTLGTQNTNPLFNFLKKINEKTVENIIENHSDYIKYTHYGINNYELFRRLVLEENNLSMSKKLKLLSEEPIKSLSITKELLPILNEQIGDSIQEEEKELFFYRFIKKRVNQINKENVVSYVVDFIRSNYKDKEIYKKYEKFIPKLVEYNNDYSDLPIVEMTDLKVIDFKINIENINKKYKVLGHTSLNCFTVSRNILEELDELLGTMTETSNKNIYENIKLIKIYYKDESPKQEILEIFEKSWSKLTNYNKDEISNDVLKSVVLQSKIELELSKKEYGNKRKNKI